MSVQDSRISLHEPRPGIATGTLTEIWRSTPTFPTIQGWGLLWYYVSRGWKTSLALPLSNAVTVLTVGVSLFLFSTFLTVITNVDRILTEAGGLLNVTLYIKDNIPDVEINNLIRELSERKSLIRSVKYVSKGEALQQFRRDLGTNGGFLIGMESDNPLPASLDLVLYPDELQINKIDRLLLEFSSPGVVDEVVYGSRWVDRLKGVVNAYRLFGFSFLCVVLIVLLFLISNTIRLAIYSRRDEIAIMQLVGASRSFVEVPFVVAGALQGLIGSGLGLVASLGAFLLVNVQLQNSSIFGVAIPQLFFLGPVAIVAILIVGVAVGAIGSLLSLGRFLNV